MGMVTAGSPAFLKLSDGKILGTATPPDPTQDVRIVPPPPAKPPVLNPAPTYVDPPTQSSTQSYGHSSGLVPGASSDGAGHGDGTKNHTGHNNPTSN